MILFVRIVSLFFICLHLFASLLLRSPNPTLLFTTKNL
nr:MAG TPA: hypothetical protein [Caudoviricetes sp.]